MSDIRGIGTKSLKNSLKTVIKPILKSPKFTFIYTLVANWDKIFDIKFMIIQFGGFISPKNFSYIVTDDTIYRFYFDIEFEQNVEKSVQFSKIRIKSTDRYELFENISNLKNNYFIMDNRLWIIGNNPRVFCVFTEAIGRNKFIGSYAIRYPETELDKFIFKLDNVFKNAENIKD